MNLLKSPNFSQSAILFQLNHSGHLKYQAMSIQKDLLIMNFTLGRTSCNLKSNFLKIKFSCLSSINYIYINSYEWALHNINKYYIVCISRSLSREYYTILRVIKNASGKDPAPCKYSICLQNKLKNWRSSYLGCSSRLIKQ